MDFPRALSAFVLAVCIAPAAAQTWPSRPLRMIVTESANSAPDLAARALGQGLTKALGQPVRVENRPGDDGVQVAAGAPRDGYTLLLAPSAVLTLFPYITDLVPYSPEDDFAGVAMVGSTPLVVVANPELNVKSLPDLMLLAREAPRRLAYATPDPHTLRGVLGEMLRQQTAMELMIVPDRGASVQDTIAGRAHFSIEPVAAILTAVQRRQLRALAVSSPKRLPELKDVATLAETLPGFDFRAWYALVAPAGTPDAVLQRLNRETARLIADAVMEQGLNLLGIYPEGASAPAQLDAFFESERAFWRKTARELRMEPQ